MILITKKNNTKINYNDKNKIINQIELQKMKALKCYGPSPKTQSKNNRAQTTRYRAKSGKGSLVAGLALLSNTRKDAKQQKKIEKT